MKKLNLLLVFSLVSTFVASQSLAGLPDFVGTWKNADPHTSGMTRLQISAWGTYVQVHAWGKCHPYDCDWGTVRGFAYAPSVSENLIHTAHSITAEYNQGFCQRLVIIHPVRCWCITFLEVEVMTFFTDGSGRAHYHEVYTFTRNGQMPGSSEEVGPLADNAQELSSPQNNNLIPKEVELYQNSPNPFNPETHIRFQLPETRHVVLKIFNALGQEIRTLVDNEFAVGEHNVVWDGRNDQGIDVPSGMYFYHLRAGSFAQTKKMTLMR